MFGLEESKKIIDESPGLIDLFENDLAMAKDVGLSADSIAAIEGLIHRQESRLAEAKLSIKFVDYQ